MGFLALAENVLRTLDALDKSRLGLVQADLVLICTQAGALSGDGP